TAPRTSGRAELSVQRRSALQLPLLRSTARGRFYGGGRVPPGGRNRCRGGDDPLRRTIRAPVYDPAPVLAAGACERRVGLGLGDGRGSDPQRELQRADSAGVVGAGGARRPAGGGAGWLAVADPAQRGVVPVAHGRVGSTGAHR